MKEKTAKTVRLVSGIVLSAMTVILAALFIWQVLDILAVGTSEGYEGFIFTRDDVAARLFRLLPAIVIWIALIIAGFVLWEVFPVKPAHAKNDSSYILKRYKKRIPAAVPEELKGSLQFINGEEENLKIIRIIAAVICGVGVLCGVIYLSNPSNFPKDDVTAEMVNMVKNVFPWVAAALVLWCGVAIYEEISSKKQLEHAKKLAGKMKVEIYHGKIYAFLNHKFFLLGARIVLGVLAVAFIIAGATGNSLHSVLIKAINICTECIGLG